MGQITSVQQQFGPNAERYARASYFGKQDSLDELMRVAHPQPTWRMLDVATGGGHCAFAFAPLVSHVIATDVTPQMLAAANGVAQERGLNNITFEPADAQELPYPDAAFDLVVCRIAAHHFSEPGQAVREMARVCKPGGNSGLVGLIDPIVPSERRLADEINEWELRRDPSTASVLTVNGWSSLFCAAGLDAVHINTFEIPLDFDDLLARSSRDAETTAQLRAGLLGGSDGMRGWLKPEMKDGRLVFVWPQLLIVGKKGG